MPRSILRVAADTGGTFTDVVAELITPDGTRQCHEAKVPSTPHDPSRAVAEGLRLMEAWAGVPAAVLIHGTTVATNAMLEGRPRRTALVLNAGFEDLLLIGRQNRRELYALQPKNTPQLMDTAFVFGVEGRLHPDGTEETPLQTTALQNRFDDFGPEPLSWAVCLLHSYANPGHEHGIRDLILARRPQDIVSLSCEVLPVFREVERASTTVANAYVRPLMQQYLQQLAALAEHVEIMGSSGGRIPVEMAAQYPVHTAVSGPAGGVVGATRAAIDAGIGAVVAFDMGGTSTDVTVCSGELQLRHEGFVGDFPLAIPMLDIHTIGAGGGSLIRVDAGGALRVGPWSAGADPGPACYGKGTEPTVTDAHAILGHLPADILLGGKHPIDVERAWKAMEPIASAIGSDVPDAARGAIRIATEKMAQAIRRMTVQRGLDPRSMTLCAFGGAGGLHVCALAELLGMKRAFIPARAGLLSAVGMLVSRTVQERSQTVLGLSAAHRHRLLNEMIQAVGGAEQKSSFGGSLATIEIRAELRFRGQSFELSVVPAEDDANTESAFREEHLRVFGYVVDSPIDWVTLRVRALGQESPSMPVGKPMLNDVVHGPAVIRDPACTVWVAAGWQALPEPTGGVVLHRVETI
ncbi:MAG: hydantoinase/oxoprolinase family protein [Myxococcales bacterium]|nr:hydantoinase/oxoprolinase family protein [Myxococcales bacterium]